MIHFTDFGLLLCEDHTHLWFAHKGTPQMYSFHHDQILSLKTGNLLQSNQEENKQTNKQSNKQEHTLIEIKSWRRHATNHFLLLCWSPLWFILWRCLFRFSWSFHCNIAVCILGSCCCSPWTTRCQIGLDCKYWTCLMFVSWNRCGHNGPPSWMWEIKQTTPQANLAG